MKKMFNIEIKETISDIFEIEAENSEEAEYLAEKGYYDGENILDGLNGQERDITCIDVDSPMYMSNIRKEEILTNLLDYVWEHCENESEYYRALKNIIGLNENEITVLGIDVKRELSGISLLESEEIEFEDELIIEEDKINAYIPLYNIDIFKKFDLKEREGFEYNMYLDYYPLKNKSVISITEKNDSSYIEYEYETSDSENEMLKDKLDKYCQMYYSASITNLLNDKEEQEEENG